MEKEEREGERDRREKTIGLCVPGFNQIKSDRAKHTTGALSKKGRTENEKHRGERRRHCLGWRPASGRVGGRLVSNLSGRDRVSDDLVLIGRVGDSWQGRRYLKRDVVLNELEERNGLFAGARRGLAGHHGVDDAA